MKKLNVNSKGYNLVLDSIQKDNMTKVCVTIPERDRHDRMVYWTYEELTKIIDKNIKNIGQPNNQNYDLFHALDSGQNKVEIFFKKEKQKNVTKTKTYQKKSKKS